VKGRGSYGSPEINKNRSLANPNIVILERDFLSIPVLDLPNSSRKDNINRGIE
jgi:hypothetical protein